jgi:hypothetical protein
MRLLLASAALSCVYGFRIPDDNGTDGRGLAEDDSPNRVICESRIYTDPTFGTGGIPHGSDCDSSCDSDCDRGCDHPRGCTICTYSCDTGCDQGCDSGCDYCPTAPPAPPPAPPGECGTGCIILWLVLIVVCCALAFCFCYWIYFECFKEQVTTETTVVTDSQGNQTTVVKKTVEPPPGAAVPVVYDPYPYGGGGYRMDNPLNEVFDDKSMFESADKSSAVSEMPLLGLKENGASSAS